MTEFKRHLWVNEKIEEGARCMYRREIGELQHELVPWESLSVSETTIWLTRARSALEGASAIPPSEDKG